MAFILESYPILFFTYASGSADVDSDCEETIKIGAHVIPVGRSLDIIPLAFEEYTSSYKNISHHTPAGFDFELSRRVFIRFSQHLLGISTQGCQLKPYFPIPLAGRKKPFEKKRAFLENYFKEVFAPVKRFMPVVKNITSRRHFSQTPRKCYNVVSTLFAKGSCARPEVVNVCAHRSVVDSPHVLTGVFNSNIVPRDYFMTAEGSNTIKSINSRLKSFLGSYNIKLSGGVSESNTGREAVQSTIEGIALARNLELLKRPNTEIKEIYLSSFPGQIHRADAIIKYADAEFKVVDPYTPISPETKYGSISSHLNSKRKAALGLKNPKEQQEKLECYTNKLNKRSEFISSDDALRERELLMEYCDSLDNGYPPHVTLLDLASFSELERRDFVE